MKTALRLLAVLALLAPSLVSAQVLDRTIREANRVAQADIDQLIALGASATIQDIDNLTHPELEGETVRFTAVVLTNPFTSGNASWVPADNRPGRVHIFVRDVESVTQGNEGMVGQIVDGSSLWQDAGVRVGDVFTIEAEVTTFDPSGAGVTTQLSPNGYEFLGTYSDLGYPESILDPITVTTDDVTNVEGGLMLVDWSVFNDYNSNYLRFENALIADNATGTNERVNYQFKSSGTEALVNSGDLSLRYRNDRDGNGYPNPPWNTRPESDPFIAPSVGAVVNIQGFATFPIFDFNNVGLLQGSFFGINPYEDSDLEFVESPPVFGEVTLPSTIPGNAPVPVSVSVTPTPGRTITSVVLDYAFEPTGTTGFVNLVDNGSGIYTGSIPVAPDGDFVVFEIQATDSNGSSSNTGEQTYRVLYNGITDIEHVQRTADGQPGASPFDGLSTTTQMNIEAVVMADFTGLYSTGEGPVRTLILQDDAGLAEWTGVHAVADQGATVQVGDRITVTGALIRENFGVTRMENLTFTVTSGGDPYDAKAVPTGVLNGDDPGLQEAHEGMFLRFNDVIVTDVNADGPDNEAGFGEFQISSDGTEANEVRVDDMSEGFPFDFNIMNLTMGASISYVQGPWYFSFGNYKLTPTDVDDIGTIVLDIEADGPSVPGSYQLGAAYPNPFNPATTIRFELGANGPATLQVYDALGRQVATLLDGTLAAGAYTATFDARGLPSGTYVYRLAAGGEVLTGRMTLVK